MLVKEAWRQKKITMKLKIKEIKSNLMSVRLEFKNLINDMKHQ